MTAARQRGRERSRGVFITFEGVEGSGKSTQIERIARRLADGGRAPVVTKEPGGTELGVRLRRLLLAPVSAPIGAEAELFLYAADRVQHLQEVVRPALERGRIVLCDRYADATAAYQGHARGLGIEVVRRLHELPALALRPDRTLLLDLEPERGLERARERDRRLGVADRTGRFEAESLEFHRAVREGYLELAALEPGRFRIVPADGDPAQVHALVVRALADLLPSTEGTG